MSATARVILPAEIASEERRAFWRVLAAGAAVLVGCLVAVLAATHHLDRDAETLAALTETQYKVRQLEALVEVGQKHGSMSVVLTTEPPSDYAYRIIAEPTLDREGAK